MPAALALSGECDFPMELIGCLEVGAVLVTLLTACWGYCLVLPCSCYQSPNACYALDASAVVLLESTRLECQEQTQVRLPSSA